MGEKVFVSVASEAANRRIGHLPECRAMFDWPGSQSQAAVQTMKFCACSMAAHNSRTMAASWIRSLTSVRSTIGTQGSLPATIRSLPERPQLDQIFMRPDGGCEQLPFLRADVGRRQPRGEQNGTAGIRTRHMFEQLMAGGNVVERAEAVLQFSKSRCKSLPAFPFLLALVETSEEFGAVAQLLRRDPRLVPLLRVQRREMPATLPDLPPALVELARGKRQDRLVSLGGVRLGQPRAGVDPRDQIDQEMPPFLRTQHVVHGKVGFRASAFEMLLQVEEFDLVGMSGSLRR